ncbi:MAG TPA: glycosyltransferase family 4 protein [Dongiaceae bacterium]|nr:glycosyltransferase family 4 protein [Dongiaceae bacterium]
MKRRILLIVPNFPKLSESFIVSKFLGLLGQGWDVQMVCDESAPGEWRHFPELEQHPAASRRVTVNWPHSPRVWAAAMLPVALLNCLVRNPAGLLRYLRRGRRKFGVGVWRQFYLDAAVIALKPDLVHFEFGALAVGRMHLKELLGCQVTVSFRGYDLNFSGLEKAGYFDAVWQDAAALHLLGDDLWQRAQRRGCPATKPHSLIPPAINAQQFEPPPAVADASSAPARPVRILSVGRLEWKKGYEHALLAIRVLCDAGVSCEYHIIGAGKYLEPLAYERFQLGLEKEVKFLGALPPAKVREHLQEADIFLHAAVSEGFCNAVLEAQSAAVPVVCSDADGLPENVIDGETGFVVPRRNPAALAEKLALLARDPEQRRRMGAAGRERVLKHFQLTDQVRNFDRFYQEALADLS